MKPKRIARSVLYKVHETISIEA